MQQKEEFEIDAEMFAQLIKKILEKNGPSIQTQRFRGRRGRERSR